MHRKERNTHIIVDHDQEQTELRFDSEMQYPSKETVWHCDVCEAVFKTLKRLRDHLFEEHADYKCSRFEASLNSEAVDGSEYEVVPKTTPRKPASKIRYSPNKLKQDTMSEEIADGKSASNLNQSKRRPLRSKIKQEREEDSQEHPMLWKCNLCAAQREFLNAGELKKHMARTHTQSMAEQVTANFGILSMEVGNLSIPQRKVLDILEKFISLCKQESSDESLTDHDNGVQLENSIENDDSDEDYVWDDDDEGDDEEYVVIPLRKRGRGRAPKSQTRRSTKSVYVPKRKYKGTGIRYKCWYCKKTFGRVSTLRDHLYLHSGQKRYRCPFCDIHLVHRGAVCQHVKNVHNTTLRDADFYSQRQRPAQDIVWKCDSCDSTFEKLYKVKVHYQDEHKLDHCDIFEAKFKMQLKQDMKLLPVKWRDEILKSEVIDDKEDSGNHGNEMGGQKPSDEVGKDHSNDSNNTSDGNENGDGEKLEDDSAMAAKDMNDEELEACLSKMYSRKVGFRCRYCHKIYTTVSSVRDHLYVHTDEKRYKCLYCDIPIKARGTLSNHMRQCHPDASISEVSQKVRQKPSKEMVWVCTYCAKTFPSVGGVRVHTLEQHGVAKNSIFEVSFSEEFESKVNWRVPSVPRRVVQEVAKKMEDKNWKYKMPDDCEYICKYCDHISARVSTLKDHLCSLHAEKPSYQCFYCNEVFKNRSVRSNHCRDVHPKEVKHKKNLGKESWQILPSQMLVWMCMECNQMFNVVNRLRYHMKESHNSADCKTFTAGLKEREDLTSGNLAPSFDCKFCGKSFDCPSKVQRHETALHQAKMPRYRCDICKKKFLTDRSLLTHKNKFHADWVSEDRPDPSTQTDERIQHLCKYCGKVFDRKCTLTFHERIHSEGRRFHCNQCPRRFLSQHVLSKHQKKVHINPPPKPKRDHICQYCGKTFTQQKVLDSHINIHLGIRPFQCKACQHTFPSRRRLSKHIWATKCKQMLGTRNRKVAQNKKDDQVTSESSPKKQKITSVSTEPVPDRPVGLVELPSQEGRDRDHRPPCRDQDEHSLSHAISMANNVIDQSPAVHVDFRQSWAVPEHHQLAGVYMPVTQWRN